MFGKIISMEDNWVTVENVSQKLEYNYINYHVIFNEENRKIVGNS